MNEEIMMTFAMAPDPIYCQLERRYGAKFSVEGKRWISRMDRLGWAIVELQRDKVLTDEQVEQCYDALIAVVRNGLDASLAEPLFQKRAFDNLMTLRPEDLE